MRISLLVITIAMLAACSDDSPPSQSAATKPAAPAAQAPATGQPATTEKGDVAAAEVAEPVEGGDPCDLSGYDMSQMTVDRHEQLVKVCNDSTEAREAAEETAEEAREQQARKAQEREEEADPSPG